jgi:hypothetical protein
VTREDRSNIACLIKWVDRLAYQVSSGLQRHPLTWLEDFSSAALSTTFHRTDRACCAPGFVEALKSRLNPE